MIWLLKGCRTGNRIMMFQLSRIALFVVLHPWRTLVSSTRLTSSPFAFWNFSYWLGRLLSVAFLLFPSILSERSVLMSTFSKRSPYNSISRYVFGKSKLSVINSSFMITWASRLMTTTFLTIVENAIQLCSAKRLLPTGAMMWTNLEIFTISNIPNNVITDHQSFFQN